METYIQPAVYLQPKSVAQIPDIDLPRIKTGEEQIDKLLFGGFVEGSRVMLWGRGGTGKSRLAMRWSTGTTNALYISLEMYEPIAAHAARSTGANPNRLFITQTYERFRKKAREVNARIVVLDSISVVPREEQKDLLGDLKGWAEKNNSVVIVICHQNKHGKHAGSHAIQHWGDMELFLTHSRTGAVIVEVLKSRSCPVGKAKTILGDGTEQETSDESGDKHASVYRLKPI